MREYIVFVDDTNLLCSAHKVFRLLNKLKNGFLLKTSLSTKTHIVLGKIVENVSALMIDRVLMEHI